MLLVQRFRSFLTTPQYQLIPFFIGLLGVVAGDKLVIPSMIVNALLLAFVLFLSDDLLPALPPAFFIITLGVSLLANLESVIPYIPFAFPTLAGLLFHLVFYRRPIFIGDSFYGLVATSVAILLGGIATPLETRDYSSGAAIYHLVGLSVGLIVFYLICASNRRPNRSYDPIEYFLFSLLLIGLLSSSIILENIVEWFVASLSVEDPNSRWNTRELWKTFMYRNTLSTLLTMCLPAPFYFARQTKSRLKEIIFFFLGIFLYGSALLTTARTVMIFTTLLLVICLIYYLSSRRTVGIKIINIGICLATACILLLTFREPLKALLEIPNLKEIIASDEARVVYLRRSFDDFMNHPLFGIGLTSTANLDVSSVGNGGIQWYHLYFPQIWGSMGILGLCAYTFQSVMRAAVIFTKPNSQSIALGLVYLGLFLYSQTDPGEFTPIPFTVLAIVAFVLLEGRLRTMQTVEFRTADGSVKKTR